LPAQPVALRRHGACTRRQAPRRRARGLARALGRQKLMASFSDRFESATYDSDEPYGVACVLPGTDFASTIGLTESCAWIPERVFARLLALGKAYDLHSLCLLSNPAVNRLTHVQASSLVAELNFLLSFIGDPVLHCAGSDLNTAATRCAQ